VRKSRGALPGVTDDRLALVLVETDAAVSLAAMEGLLREQGAVSVTERDALP
jgi:hypothetical protein